VGIKLSADVSQVVTGIRSASRSQGVGIRRQAARITGGGKEGGYGHAFEVVCCDCGDRPYRGYSEISLSLQRIRGPYATMAAAVVAYDQHLGLTTSRRRS
jgi:hypothetical protein